MIGGTNKTKQKGKINDQGGKNTIGTKSVNRASKEKASVVGKSKAVQPKNTKLPAHNTKKPSNANTFTKHYGSGVLNGDKATKLKGDGLEDRGNTRLKDEIRGVGGTRPVPGKSAL